MEFIKTDINFSKEIALCFMNDTDYCLSGGKKEDSFVLRNLYAKTLYQVGDVYKIVDKKPLGFLLIENNKTFHMFVLKKVKGDQILKNVFDLCFNKLGYNKIFTLTNDRLTKMFIRRKVMKNENKKRLGYDLFSLTKEAYSCR